MFCGESASLKPADGDKGCFVSGSVRRFLAVASACLSLFFLPT